MAENKERKRWWECSACGYTFQAVAPPEKCPGCVTACAFKDVTCYAPDCGGPSQPDPRLFDYGKK